MKITNECNMELMSRYQDNHFDLEIVDEILDMWKDLKTGRAKDQAAKKRMIETYNTIYNTNYSHRTNCGSCISTCFDGIKKLYKEYAKG